MPKPSTTNFKVAETSASRPASRTIFLKRVDSSTEIIFAPGETGQLAMLAALVELRRDALLRAGHRFGGQSIFLERVISGDHFHRTQRHYFALEHEAHILPLHRLFEPIAQPPASLGDRQSLHTLILAYISLL